MSDPLSLSQLKTFFRFPFQDSSSKSRFAIGSLLVLAGFIVPILPGLIAYGYCLRILRRSAEGEPPTMPPWDDWSAYLSLGFRGAIVHLTFLGPALIVFVAGMALYVATFFMIPLADSPGANASDGAIALVVLLAMASMFGSMAVGSVLLLLGTLPLPAAMSHFAVTDQLSAAFRFREWWGILWANRLGYFIAFVIVAGILGLAYFAFFIFYASVVFLCLGYLLTIPVAFYAMLVAAGIFGAAYREGLTVVTEA
jgi:hypothetical protein